MNSYEQELFCELKKIGINAGVLKLLPAQPVKISRMGAEFCIWKAEDGDYAFWVDYGQESSLAIRDQILRNFEKKGFTGFLYPVELNDGRTYARLDERRWFYLTRWPEMRRLYFSDHHDLRSIIGLITEFRKVVKSSGPLFCLPDRKETNNLIVKFHAVIESFNSFNLLAGYRLRPSKFDQLFAVYVSEAINQTKRALHILEESQYLNLSGRLTTRDLIINRLVRSNLRIAKENHAVCLKLNDYRWDLPIIDLAILIIKTGRASRWSRGWFEMIIMEYQKQFPVTPEEWKILYAYIIFPWSFYRLSSRYYYNRVEWSLGTLVSRMERIIEDDKYRLEFLKSFQEI